MRTTDTLLPRLFTACLVFLSSTALLASAQQATQQHPATQSAAPAKPDGPDTIAASMPAQPQGTDLPDSPGAVRLQSGQQNPAPEAAQQASQQSSQSASPAAKPSGTAAAEMTNSGGATGSEPAGVAIAPAKQRRTRALLIKMGAVVGAGVAIGTVVALSRGTPSLPPGAH